MLVFGLNVNDGGNQCHRTDYECQPVPEYNMAFDLSSATVQRKLLVSLAATLTLQSWQFVTRQP